MNLLDEEDGEDLLCHFTGYPTEAIKLRQLLDLRCVPSNQPCRGSTPLITAIYSREPEIIKILLEAGADPNVIGFSNEDKITALDAALGDYCTCDTPEEMEAMGKIEALIRSFGGRTHSS